MRRAAGVGISKAERSAEGQWGWATWEEVEAENPINDWRCNPDTASHYLSYLEKGVWGGGGPAKCVGKRTKQLSAS